MTQRWVNLGLILFGFALFFMVYNIMGAVWELTHWPIPADWPLGPVELLGFVVTLGTVLVIRFMARTNAFLNEVAVELSKVSWPPQQETLISTGIVAVMTGICVLILFLFDTVWGTVTKQFLVR